jgi:hypothetical protein
LVRVAGRDDVIPLAIPQKTRAGEIITTIPVSKGQRIIISISAYNRCVVIFNFIYPETMRYDISSEGLNLSGETTLISGDRKDSSKRL